MNDERPSWTPTLLKCLAVFAATVPTLTWIVNSLAVWLAEKLRGWIPRHPVREILLWVLSRAWMWGIAMGIYTGVAISLVIIALDARKGRLPPWR